MTSHIAEIIPDWVANTLCIVRHNPNDVTKYSLNETTSSTCCKAEDEAVLRLCASAKQHHSQLRDELQKANNELLEMRDGEKPLSSRALMDVRQRLHNLWHMTTLLILTSGHLDDPSVLALMSSELDKVFARFKPHFEQCTAGTKESVPTFKKNAYAQYTITSIDYHGVNQTGGVDGSASLDITRTCTNYDIAVGQHKPILQVDHLTLPLQTHDQQTSALGAAANQENHAIALCIAEARRIWEIESAQTAVGSCLLKDVPGSWKNSEEKVGYMMAYLKTEIHKTEQVLRSHVLAEGRGKEGEDRDLTLLHSKVGDNSKEAALNSRLVYGRLEELRGVERVVEQCTDLKASLLDTLRKQRNGMKKVAEYKDDIIRQRDMDLETLHRVISTLRSQLQTVTANLRECRRQLTMRNAEAQGAIDAATTVVQSATFIRSPSPSHGLSNLEALPARHVLTNDAQDRLLRRLYNHGGRVKGSPPGVAAKSLHNTTKKLTEDEVGEVNSRLYYRVVEHEKHAAVRLDEKYGPERILLQKRPTSAPLSKDKLKASIENLFYRSVKEKGRNRADLFRKLVTEKEKKFVQHTPEQMDETSQRLFTSSGNRKK